MSKREEIDGRWGQIMLGFCFDFTLNSIRGNSLAVQWLGLRTFTAEGSGSIPGRELRSYKLHGVAKKIKQ